MLAQSRLDAACQEAAVLDMAQSSVLDYLKTTPKHAMLHNVLQLPMERDQEIHRRPPPNNQRLPLRILTKEEATDLEKSMWRAYSEHGLHELLNDEYIAALASRIRSTLARCEIRGLSSRADLNGQPATVIGPLDPATGRMPVKVDATGEGVKARPRNLYDGSEEDALGLPLVLELGAGSGALAYHLGIALSGYARVVATDNKPAAECACTVEKMDAEAAVASYQPTLALISWQPSGIDWTLHCRACTRLREYILLGESDGSTCGDGWATWGIVPPNGYEYGLDEDSVAPYKVDGFERVSLPAVEKYQICRFDSSTARGYSNAIAFSRKEETLEESWGRMQQSVAQGTAQRLDVQMAMDITG